jgi:molecular chaperone DnaK
VTVMQIQGTQFSALSTDGDVRLGGYDWDQRLVDLVAKEFSQQHHVDPRQDVTAAGKLWRECEDAKRTLTARQKAVVPCDFRGASARIEVTRQQFEDATQDLLDRTRFTSTQAVKAAKLDWKDIDRVLLVGGSSRMPMVREMLRQLSGKDPDDSVAADEAVAHGAALHASLILTQRLGRPPAFKIRNVNSHSLGVVGVDPVSQRRRNGILIPRNTALPVAAKRAFHTKKAGQRSIRVEIVEGESPSADDCTQIGHCAVHELPDDLPAKAPVEVLFRYQADGRLRVHVSLPGTNHEVATEIVRSNSLSKEELDHWRERVSGLPPTDYQ